MPSFPPMRGPSISSHRCRQTPSNLLHRWASRPIPSPSASAPLLPSRSCSPACPGCLSGATLTRTHIGWLTFLSVVSNRDETSLPGFPCTWEARWQCATAITCEGVQPILRACRLLILRRRGSAICLVRRAGVLRIRFDQRKCAVSVKIGIGPQRVTRNPLSILKRVGLAAGALDGLHPMRGRPYVRVRQSAEWGNQIDDGMAPAT